MIGYLHADKKAGPVMGPAFFIFYLVAAATWAHKIWISVPQDKKRGA
jgi:hypothetical protein